MEPRPVGIQDIALHDPVAAYGMAINIPRVPICLNIPAVFSSFNVAQIPVVGDLRTTIATRTWVDNIQYSLQQPNVFNGNVFKTLYDAMLKAQPGISVRVSVQSGPKYLVSPQFTPIENFVNLIQSRWPAGWPIFKQQSIQVEYILTQAPPSVSPNGPPYNVTLTFVGWQFLDTTLDDMSADDANARLAAMGFCVSNPSPGLRRTGG